MKLGWATDLHLNLVEAQPLQAFVRQVNEAALDYLVITGDLSDARRLQAHLAALGSALDPPMGFVLGNHDFYGSSFAAIEAKAPRWAAEAGCDYLHGAHSALDEAEGTWLLGDNGWADGTAGLGASSRIELNDYYQIDDFRDLDVAERFALLRQRGEDSAKRLDDLFRRVIDRDARRIVVATHVPPFAEAAWHEGRPSDAEWAPHFSAPLVGRMLLSVADAHRERELLVLCGHTHGAGVFRPRANLTVYTGGATYGQPVLQAVLRDGEVIQADPALAKALD